MYNLKLCQICHCFERKYLCPRCNYQYCSVECYKSEKHQQCSETFYKECILEELKLEGGDPESQRKMLQILKRHQTQEDEELDSDDDLELSERLKDLDLDDSHQIWECLNESEKLEFVALIRSGDIYSVVPMPPPWEPWWNYKKKKSLVEEMDSPEDEIWLKKCPPLKKDIPPLSQITKRAPAPEVGYNVVNVLAAYCYVTRYCLGEHLKHPYEPAYLLERLSGTLHANYNYHSGNAAFDAVVQDVISTFGDPEEALQVMKDDVKKIIAGPDDDNPSFYIKACLSDIYQLFTLAYKKRKTGLQGNERNDVTYHLKDLMHLSFTVGLSKEKLFLLKKKIEFYLSWANEYLIYNKINY